MTGKDMLLALGQVDRKYIQEAEFETMAKVIDEQFTQEAPSGKRRSPLKVILVAALISLLLAGCTYAVLKVQDMMYEEVTVTQRFDEYGETIEPTEKILERYTPFSLTDGPMAQAAKEWNEYLDSCDLENVDMELARKTLPENYYTAYECYNQEMMEKLDEILAKYNLKPVDRWCIPISGEFGIMYDAYGMDGILLPGAEAEIVPSQAQFNSCGSFEVFNHITLTGSDAIYKKPWDCFFDYAKKDYFWERMGAAVAGEYEQWNYTTADGTKVLLVLRDQGAADIIADVGDACIYIVISPYDGLEGRIPSREALEQMADIFDYHMDPQPFDRAEVEPLLESGRAFEAQRQAEALEYRQTATVSLERCNAFGGPDSPRDLADREWNEFLNSYCEEGAMDMKAALENLPENYCYTYECYTQEMADKLDEIAGKYNLKLLDTWCFAHRSEKKIMYDAYGIDGIVRPDSQVAIEEEEAQFNSDGTFESKLWITMTGADAQWREKMFCFFDFAKPDVFWERTATFVPGEYEQWNYTTADGTAVRLVLCQRGNGYIFADADNGTVFVNIFFDKENGQIPTKEGMEQIADIFDYKMNPQPFNRTEIKAKLGN